MTRSSQQHPTPAHVDLILEFSGTTLTQDTEDKRKIYAIAGITDYWVVNLRNREVIVYRQPVHGDYQVKRCVRQGVISPLAFADIVIAMNTLL